MQLVYLQDHGIYIITSLASILLCCRELQPRLAIIWLVLLVVTSDKPGCSALDCFKLLNVSGSVWVPGSSCVLHHRLDKRGVALSLDSSWAPCNIPPQESKGVVCLFCNFIHMIVPGQVISSCDPEVLSFFDNF